MRRTRSYGPWWKRVLCFIGIHTDCHFYEMSDEERQTREGGP